MGFEPLKKPLPERFFLPASTYGAGADVVQGLIRPGLQ